jgi:hypothetical protein
MALTRHLQSPWQEKLLFNQISSQAVGLIIITKAVALALEHCSDSTEPLKATLQDSVRTGLKSLYIIYSSILRVHRAHRNAEFQQMIGVLLTTTPFRPLCKGPITELAGVNPNHVPKCEDDLSSLLYQDKWANGVIHVRHLSISDFSVSKYYDYQVNLQGANIQLGITCLMMISVQLCFNICNLEDYWPADADLRSPIPFKENLSNPLQYCSHKDT